MRKCTVVGCGKTVSGYSKLCSNHSKTKARHGHPLQTSVKRRELQPYEKAIKKWLSNRAKANAWDILRDLWNTILHQASVYFERRGNGRPYQRDLMRASQIILNVEKEGRSDDAILRMLALGYFRHAYPKRFRSDDAFQFQVARQVRALTDNSAGIYWDDRKQTTKKVYRDVSPKTLRALWALLSETHLTGYGRQIGEADLRERSQPVHKSAEVSRALLGVNAYEATVARAETPK